MCASRHSTRPDPKAAVGASRITGERRARIFGADAIARLVEHRP
jgi:hypothetical protein